MNKINLILKLSLAALSLCAVSETWAVCKYAYFGGPNTINTTQYLETDDASAAKMRFGTVQLMDEAVQAAGSTMAAITVPPTEYKARNTTAETILYQCDIGDENNITYLVSNNADDAYSGGYEVPTADSGGQTGVFYTGFRRVGLKLTMEGKVINKYWQAVPVSNYDTGNGTNGCPAGKICIRLKHIPNLQAELIRIRSCTTTQGNTCFIEPLTSQYYTHNQPSAYIQLSNKGTNGSINTPVGFGHDAEGEIHYAPAHYDFFGADNGFAYTLFNSFRIVNESNNSCALIYNTPVVTFPNATVQALNAGGQVATDFDIQVECKNGFIAGTANSQNAFGIQINGSSYSYAQTNGLVNGSNGVTALVSDDYNSNANRAKNVGVFLANPANNNAMNFIGQPGLTGSFAATTATGCSGICYPAITYPQGNAAGWYAINQNAVSLGSANGHTKYRIPMRAVLKKLPASGAVTAGSVNATATVLVKVQ